MTKSLSIRVKTILTLHVIDMVKHKMSVVVAVQVFLNCASLAESSS